MTSACARPISAGRMLEIQSLVAGYGAGTVLDGIDFAVAKGEIVALLGRNGMGKTTLLRAIMGLAKPRGGSIRFDGRMIGGLDTFEIARLGIALVPQGREIFGDLTVAENLRLGARGGGIDRAYGLFPALEAKAEGRAGGLSGGQQQQLAIARALLAKPRLLLLDEPSEGIQPSIVAEIGRAIGEAARADGIAVVLVEQNIALALSLARRADFLGGGRITGSFETRALRPADIARHMGI
jgi:ABC-type branched-subunit amino acid transport system ATPase component